MSLNEFLKRVRRVRDEAINCAAYPIGEDDAVTLYVITYILSSISRDCITIVEVGSGCGYSTLWLAKALNDSRSCGKIVGFEKINYRALRALKNLKELNLDKYVEIRAINALEGLKKIDYIIDMVFLDADIENYSTYLNVLDNRLSEKAVIASHNAYWLVNTDFIDTLKEYGFRVTIIPTEEGILLAVRGEPQKHRYKTLP